MSRDELRTSDLQLTAVLRAGEKDRGGVFISILQDPKPNED